jgi:hypothetical protein
LILVRRPQAALIGLLLIVLLGAALRLYNITGNPPELVADELDLYNSARSIATTGHDVDGTLMPFLYCPFTRNPPMYAAAEYVTSLVLGDGPFGLRFPAVVFGLIAVVLMYAIALELTRRKDVALVTALLVAVCPIFVHFSRIGWEPASELPFLLGGLYLALRTFLGSGERGERLSLRGVLWAAALLGLTSYTYMAGWFYAAVLGIAIVLLNAPRLRGWAPWAKVLAGLATWVAISWPALTMWFGDPHTYQRTARISTFVNGVSWQALQIFAAHYLAQFRWSYLATDGDAIPGSTWRYMNGFGAFYWWVIPLAAIGLLCAWRFIRPRWAMWWVVIWLFVYPLGGALTNEAVPNAPRTLAGAPVFCLLAAVGFAALLDLARSLRRPRLRRASLFVIRAFLAVNVAVSVVLFSAFYFREYAHLNPNAWDSGTRDTFALIRRDHAQYDRMCFQIRQAWYPADSYFLYYLSDVHIATFDDIMNPLCFQRGTLIVTDNAVYRFDFKVVTTIRDVDGASFAVVEARPR